MATIAINKRATFDYEILEKYEAGLMLIGLGAAAIGDAIYVAGGGVVMGGDVQSAVHEAFTLAQP